MKIYDFMRSLIKADCIRLLLLLIISSLAVQAVSADDGSLEVRTDDGHVTRFLLDKTPRITFTETELVVSAGDEQVMFDLPSVSEYRIIQSISGLEEEQIDNLTKTVKIRDGQLISSSGEINIYSIDGKLILSRTQEPWVPISIDGFPQGIYVVKAGDTTFKIAVK